MKPLVLFTVLFIWISGTAYGQERDIPLSDATADCIECHAEIHPGIVHDWQKSRHARITPQQGANVTGLSRRVSNPAIPADLQTVVVGCAECHNLRPESHTDTFEHNGYEIHMVVSPDDCRTCHLDEARQYSKNLMSHAYRNLAGNSIYQALQGSILDTPRRQGTEIDLDPADPLTRAEACYYCHGTRLKITGTETRDTDLAGELQFPLIAGWPNQGVGRINPDQSRGACSACHTRHLFSIETARKPYTCKECHAGPDVPAFKVYSASKHGNLFNTHEKSWNFDSLPWRVGEDFSAPTCAACHISLLVKGDGEQFAPRTHQMNDRLAWRIFGLIYAHPHPLSPDTTLIRNSDNLPLPTDFKGGLARSYLIDSKEMERRRMAMQGICAGCHGSGWIAGHWKRFENSIKETNAKTLVATQIMSDIWERGFAQGPDRQKSPFDEAIERQWSHTWLFYANTIRFASAMAGGGDYGVFAEGRYRLSETILEMDDWLKLQTGLPEPGSAKNE